VFRFGFLQVSSRIPPVFWGPSGLSPTPLEGGVSPRERRNPLEGDVIPRARQNPLGGAFDWATLVGRGGHRGVGRALRVRLSKRCVLFRFLQVLSRIPPVF
jgi:hypothetical protein